MMELLFNHLLSIVLFLLMFRSVVNIDLGLNNLFRWLNGGSISTDLNGGLVLKVRESLMDIFRNIFVSESSFVSNLITYFNLGMTNHIVNGTLLNGLMNRMLNGSNNLSGSIMFFSKNVDLALRSFTNDSGNDSRLLSKNRLGSSAVVNNWFV